MADIAFEENIAVIEYRVSDRKYRISSDGTELHVSCTYDIIRTARLGMCLTEEQEIDLGFDSLRIAASLVPGDKLLWWTTA
jgi:hypothetical protein